MKRVLTILIILFLSSSVFADWGFFGSDRSWISINFNGSVTSYRLYNGGIVSGSGYFNGANLGSFTNQSQTLAIQNWDVKTFKNGNSDVQQARMFYRVYESTLSGGSFIEITGGFLSDLGGGDQLWGTLNTNPTSIDISSLDPGKTYNLEVYIEVFGDDDNSDEIAGYWISDDNSNNNFIATFSTDAAFPVELTSFTSSIIDRNVNLIWETATEVDNYGFNVERKPETGEWKEVGFIAGAGNSNSPKKYSFADRDALTNGAYSYRLKQIDTDGKFEYSNSINVKIDAPSEFLLEQNYPNPFNPETSIKFSVAESGFANLKIYNGLGEQVAELFNQPVEAGKLYEVNFNGSALSSGVYYYKLTSNNFSSVRKMLLVK